MKRFFDPCRHHRQNIALLAAGALPDAEKDQIESHLAGCADCRKYFEEIKAVTAPLANWADDFAQLQPSQSVQTRWSKAIRDADRPAAIRQPEPAIVFRGWWHDVIWPHRRIWTGLAAVWVMILAGNFSLQGHGHVLAAKSASQAMTASFTDQQRILAELLAGRFGPREAEPQKMFSPGPRTETLMTMTT